MNNENLWPVIPQREMNHIDGVMVSVLPSSGVDRGFKPR